MRSSVADIIAYFTPFTGRNLPTMAPATRDASRENILGRMTGTKLGVTFASLTQRHDRAGNSPRKVLLASVIGTTIEFFDFYIYATAAVLVFPKLFFPAGNAHVQ